MSVDKGQYASVIYMTADSFFIKGYWTLHHYVCQDYAGVLADPLGRMGEEGEVNSDEALLGVVSDGCGSVRGSDIGSRLITHSLMARIRHLDASLSSVDLNDPESARESVAKMTYEAAFQANTMLPNLGLGKDTLAASCLYAHVRKDRYIVGGDGDGVILVATGDGVCKAYCINFKRNIPHYPYYGLRHEYQAQFEANADNEKEVSVYERNLRDPLSVWQQVDRFEQDARAFGIANVSDDLWFAGVISDGAFNLEDKANGKKTLTHLQALTYLVDFKHFLGPFAKRKQNIVHRNALQGGIQPGDDLSMSIVYLRD